MDQEQMLDDYGDLVWKIAHDCYQQFHLKTTSVTEEDLYQEGIIEMYSCTDRYDPDKGAKFSSYMYYPVRTKMFRYISSNWSSINLPQRFIENWSFLKEYEKLHEEDEEYGLKQKNSSGTTIQTMQFASTVSSEAYRQWDDNGREGEVAERGVDDSFRQLMQETNRCEALYEAFQEVLDPRERFVVETYFGLYDEPQPLRVIGKYVNMTHQGVGKVKDKALAKIRAWFDDQNITLADLAEV